MIRMLHFNKSVFLAVGIITLILFCCVSKTYSQEEHVRIPEISIEKTEKMINVGGRKLHCCVYGKDSPTVILVSGFRAPQSYWNTVIPELADVTTVVTYDRPGYGKSELGSLPLHGKQTSKELNILLEKLNVPEPFILVGHSYGGRIVRLFASMYPETLGGLILEDTQHEDILEEQIKVLRGNDKKQLQNVESMLKNRSRNPKSESDYNYIINEQLRSSNPLPDIPFTVLTAGSRENSVPPMFSKEGREKMIKAGLEMQKKLVSLIPGGKHVIVEGAGHNIHLEKPEVLINEIKEMINIVRSKK